MNGTLKIDKVIDNKINILSDNIFALGIYIMWKPAYTFLYAYYMAGFFMILIPVAEILSRL